MFPFPGIGLVFDIDGLGGGHYGLRAWRVYMTHLEPTRLGTAILVEGDTNATLQGAANEFCIGTYGSQETIDYIRDRMEGLSDPGLASFQRRFIESAALASQPLVIKGQLDGFTRLVTDQWTRMDHDLCLEFGWRYAPRRIPTGLQTETLKQLETLKQPRL